MGLHELVGLRQRLAPYREEPVEQPIHHLHPHQQILSVEVSGSPPRRAVLILA
jgi:hypothetical protein